MSRAPRRESPYWQPFTEGDPVFDAAASAPQPELTEVDNPVVGTIVDRKGRPMVTVRERKTERFGYVKRDR